MKPHSAGACAVCVRVVVVVVVWGEYLVAVQAHEKYVGAGVQVADGHPLRLPRRAMTSQRRPRRRRSERRASY
jgi:hypothetical protein